MPTLAAFRWYCALTFAFAWVPVMYTAFTVERGFRPSQYLQLWGLYYGAMMLSELPWGWLADRWSRRALLRLGPLCLGICFALLGEARDFVACCWLMAAIGSAHAMISGADSAYLYELLAGQGRSAEALREETRAHRWRLFGVSILDVLGGLVAFSWGTTWCFHASALIMFAAAAVAFCLPAPPAQPSSWPRERVPLRTTLLSLLRPGVPWVLLWYVAVFVLLRVGFQLYQPTLLAVGADDLRLHGLLLGLLNLAAGLAAFFVLRVHARLGEAATGALVLLLIACSFAGLAGLSGWALFPLFCLQQIGFAFLQPVGRTALNHRIPEQGRAALLSAQSLLARLVFALLLLLGDWDGSLDESLGLTYAGLALVALLLAAVCLRWRPTAHAKLETGHGD
ncbi:MAG: MFS transporter [Planctomycetota bacterium]